MTYAEDKRPEGIRLIGLRPYALHGHTQSEYQHDLSLSTLAEYRFVASVNNDSGWVLETELNCCNGLYHTKTQTIAIGPVLPPKTWHFNSTQFSISVLTISWLDQYVDCTVLPALSPPDFRFVIWPMIIVSLLITHKFRSKLTLVS
jgi:hypothetical protein